MLFLELFDAFFMVFLPEGIGPKRRFSHRKLISGNESAFGGHYSLLNAHEEKFEIRVIGTNNVDLNFTCTLV